MKLSEAIYLRSVVEQAATSLDDKIASTAPTLFRRLQEDGKLIEAGTRINWNGTVKKATVDIWDAKENSPDNAPTLWADLAYRDGIRIIPEVVTVTLSFKKDELGWWGDALYRSKVDGNVYTPEQYPSNWEKVE